VTPAGRQKKAERVTVVGYYGMGNFGDDLFCEVLEDHAEQLFPESLLKFLGTFAPATDVRRRTQRLRRLYAQPGWAGSLTRALLAVSSAFTSDRIVLGGGSVLADVRGARGLQWRLSRLTRTQFSALGISLGPFATPAASRRVARFGRGLDGVIVRDSASVQIATALKMGAREMGFAPVLGGDLAALYDFPPPQKKVDEAATRNVGLALCNFPGFSRGDLDALLEGLVLALTRTHRTGIQEHVTVLALDNHGHNGDDALAHYAVASLRRSGIDVTMIRYVDVGVAGMISVISGLDSLCAVRLHAAIVAYLARVPFALVEYHPKCAAFCTDVGQPESQRIIHPATSLTVMASLNDLLSRSALPEYPASDYRVRARETYLGLKDS
jgi:polysaccharide pyruvyl transferase WcaK-like protein